MLLLSKLETLLSTKGFIIKKIYVISGMCVYLEILCLSSADIFLLYIPSKYDISAKDSRVKYKIEYIEFEELDNIPGNYAGEPDKLELEGVYEEINLEISADRDNKDDLEEHLEESYKRPVSLKDSNKNDTKEIKDIFRQLKRLRFCVQNIKYKLAIQFKNYICCVRRDDSVDCFCIKHYRGEASRKLFIIVDLETLYDKISSVETDIKTVRDGVYKVLNKNQLLHSKHLNKAFEERNNLAQFSEGLYQQKSIYTEYINNLESMLFQLCDSEKKIVEKLFVVQEKYNTMGIKGVHEDIANSHEISKYESQLEKMGDVKQEIINNILILKTKEEDIYLKCDKTFFDNSVMLDAVVRNVRSLETL